MKPHPVVVLRAAPAPEDWNARFSAHWRARYRYRILNRRARPALRLGRVWHVPHRLDAEAMHAAAQTPARAARFHLVPRRRLPGESPLRTLDRLDVRRDGDMVEIVAEARSFLHHQVRNMVGTLKLVGDGTGRSARRRRGAGGPRPRRRRPDRAARRAVPVGRALSRSPAPSPSRPPDESFFFLFYKKEALPLLSRGLPHPKPAYIATRPSLGGPVWRVSAALTGENPALAEKALILARPVTPERRMADAIRALAIDAVEQAKSGHPGLPLGAADIATVCSRKS